MVCGRRAVAMRLSGNLSPSRHESSANSRRQATRCQVVTLGNGLCLGLTQNGKFLERRYHISSKDPRRNRCYHFGREGFGLRRFGLNNLAVNEHYKLQRGRHHQKLSPQIRAPSTCDSEQYACMRIAGKKETFSHCAKRGLKHEDFENCICF